MACVLTICKIILPSQVFEHEQTSARPFYFTIHHTTYVSHLDLDLDKLSAYLENGYRNKRYKSKAMLKISATREGMFKTKLKIERCAVQMTQNATVPNPRWGQSIKFHCEERGNLESYNS